MKLLWVNPTEFNVIIVNTGCYRLHASKIAVLEGPQTGAGQ